MRRKLALDPAARQFSKSTISGLIQLIAQAASSSSSSSSSTAAATQPSQLKAIFITFDEVGRLRRNADELMELRTYILSVWQAYQKKILPPGLTVYFYICSKHIDLASVDNNSTGSPTGVCWIRLRSMSLSCVDAIYRDILSRNYVPFLQKAVKQNLVEEGLLCELLLYYTAGGPRMIRYML